MTAPVDHMEAGCAERQESAHDAGARVLFPHAIESLEEYLERGGGAGLEAARGLEPEAIVAQIEASGLRGRGGAGFPTGRKWRTVAENRSPPTLPGERPPSRRS